MFGIAKIPTSMFGKAKIHISNVWKSQNSQFQCLKKEKSRIPTFGNAKIHNSNAWKRKSLEFQCLELPKFPIPMFGKAKIHYSNV